MPTEPPTPDILKKLEEIALHLKHLDQRDHNRMMWSWMKSVVGAVMFAFALFGSWYFVSNLGEVMKLAVQEGTKQSQQAMQSGAESYFKQFQNMLSGAAGGSQSSSRARSSVRK